MGKKLVRTSNAWREKEMKTGVCVREVGSRETWSMSFI